MEIFIKSQKNDKIKKLDKIKTGCWVKLVSPKIEELRRLSHAYKIPLAYLKSGLDKDESQRYEEHNGIKMFIIKIPKISDDEGRISKLGTIPLTIIITKDNVFTVCLKDSSVFKKFEKNEVKGFHTTMRTRFALQIFNETSKYYVELLDSIEDKINGVERKLNKSLENKEILQLLGLQKTLVYFNKAILGNNRIFENVMSGKYLQIYQDDIDLLERIMLENKESLELVNIHSDLLNNTIDAYASIISNNLNVVMKVLASLTIIAGIPTILASLYGMNVLLPFQQSPDAFTLIILMSGFLMLLTLFIFKKIRWV